MTVALTLDEARAAYRVGLERHAAARARGGTHLYGWNDPDPAKIRHADCVAAVAEALVAKTLGRPWLSAGLVPDDPRAGDVAGGVHVRHTELERGSLILHESDVDELVGVLVVGVDPRALRVAGWITNADGKDARFWRDDVRHPAYFVPQRELAPIDELSSRSLDRAT